MDEKDWKDNDDFWDDEADDDDDFNDCGNDNIDANNDETFGQACEWDENEHEDLAAREEEMKLRTQMEDFQQQQRLLKQQKQQQIQIQQEQLRQEQHARQQLTQMNFNKVMPRAAGPKVMTVDELEKQFLRANISQQSPQQPQNRVMEARYQPIGTPSQSQLQPNPRNQQQQQNRAAWSPFMGKDLFDSDKLPPMPQAEYSPQIQLPPMSIEQETILLRHQIMQRQQHLQQLAMLEELQQQQQQQQLLIQQQQRLRQLLEARSAPVVSPPKPRCLTVEELERQMLADRPNQILQPNNSINDPNEQEQMLIKYMVQKFREEVSEQSKAGPIVGSSGDHGNHSDEQTRRRRHGDRQDNNNSNNNSNAARKRDAERDHQRPERGGGRVLNDSFGRRDNRREHHYKHSHRRETTILPPQVQLSVIDKNKSLFPLKPLLNDEYLVDRMPNPEGSIQTRKHSTMANMKARHDGILTEQERNWLTKVQKKIQADCDEILDQDYYYLLYFNRSSMTDEANKPSGPSVLDKRFIPRERLLYNNAF